MTSQPLTTLATAPVSPIAYPVPKLALAALVALSGDSLFFGRALGVSIALFLTLVAVAALVATWSSLARPRGRDLVIAGLLMLVGLAPLIETTGPLSLAFGVAGLALAVAVLNGDRRRSVRAIATSAGRLVLTGPFTLPPTVLAVTRSIVATGYASRAAALRIWLLPVALCAVFAVLFVAANPLIEGWVDTIPWSALIPHVDLPRLLLWLALLAFAWAFVAPHPRGRSETAGEALDRPMAADPAAVAPWPLLGPGMVLRCLVLFNLLFLVQSATDVAYLWAGFALPPGVSHAAYAHRGAYPLVVTALLAAAFVLLALRRGDRGEHPPITRALVCLWIGQNVLLVISAIRRLDLYVDAFGLSLLRFSALIWMALVAVGLGLILARIVLRRGNGWLVRANILTLTATLYVCGFTNFAGTVADYNAAHRSGAEHVFDFLYAMDLGAAAIPAVDRMLTTAEGPLTETVRQWRAGAADDLRTRMRDWRAWTFRDQRLLDYLDAHPDAPAATH